MYKSLFITHKNLLGEKLSITGGVQLCSQEFYKVLEKSGFGVSLMYMNYTRKIVPRILIRLGMDCYNTYDVKRDQTKILDFIERNKIEYVFINHASAIRYAKPVKEFFGENVKVFLLSHGNDSGDHIHTITKSLVSQNFIQKFIRNYKLGRLIATESLYRNKYLDGVLTVSEIEEQIEKWLGAKKIVYLPRLINKNYNLKLNTNYSKIGFIGRLDHPPNFIGIKMLFNSLQKHKNNVKFELALIGAPEHVGEKFAKDYSFISYKGELLDKELDHEIATWAFFLNPVFWYSMGVSTKIGKAIEWGVPVITTKAGIKGYYWDKGEMTYVNDEDDMAITICKLINNKSKIDICINEMIKIKSSSIEIDSLKDKLKII